MTRTTDSSLGTDPDKDVCTGTLTGGLGDDRIVPELGAQRRGRSGVGPIVPPTWRR